MADLPGTDFLNVAQGQMTERADGRGPEDTVRGVGTKFVLGAARILRRLGFKRGALWMEAWDTQRWLVSRYAGAEDDKDNRRTTPPEDERVSVYSLWMVEVFPPSLSAILGRALRELPPGGIYREKDIAEEVARARRHSRGGSWWNLGFFINQLYGQGRVGGSRVTLPHQVDHLALSLHLVTPSLACAVGQFVLTDDAGSALESILRMHYSTRAERKRYGAVGIDRPAEIKRDLVADELSRVRNDCASWFRSHLPGAFCQGLLDGTVPTCWFLSLDKVKPFSDEAGLGYVEPLGLQMDYRALQSEDLPGLRLSEPTGVRRPAHTFFLAGKYGQVFPDEKDLGGHKRGRDGFTVALWMRWNTFMAMWGLERTLLGYEMAFAKIRDSFAALRNPPSLGQNLSSLAIANENLARLGADSQAVASDAALLASDPALFDREMPSLEPVQPRFWRGGERWNDMLKEGIELSARRVRENESAARSLEVTRASLVSSRTNLLLQVSLRRLTWFLVILTIALVVVAVATLRAME